MTQAEHKAEQDKALLGRYLPATAVDWVYSFVLNHSVQLRICRDRATKLGDYRLPSPQHPNHAISVNGGLNKYMFFTVLLHEIAHLLVAEQYGRKAQPHGPVWQQKYTQLLIEHKTTFPDEVQPLLSEYAMHLPLSKKRERAFESALRRYDANYTEPTLLDSLTEGDIFGLNNKVFRADKKRRTRWICTDISTGKQFLVSGAAPVEVMDANN